MTLPETGKSKPVTDLSQNAISLARSIDRLPDGEYSIRIIKDTSLKIPWRLEIVRVEVVSRTIRNA